MAEGLRTVFGFLASLPDACSVLVILLGVIRAMVHYFRPFPGSGAMHVAATGVRLGQSTVVALDFQVAANILRFGQPHAWNDLLFSAVPFGLRSVLSYFRKYAEETVTG
ncbi:MAG TPA: DUF1622 domain-containing protein [Anaerolineae bacterium]|nr:DUF1622 domain-containing protein [Anaerolineae bacterium]